MDKKLITIGKITNKQGNKGEVRVIPLTDFPERYINLLQVYLEKGEQLTTREIENVWFHRQYVIIKFTGINNIGEALTLKNSLIKIPETELIPLKKNEYYIYQILGFKVITTKGKLLGRLQDVISTGGTDIFVVGDTEDPEKFMVPAASEFVTDINFDRKTIRVKPLPGLLDL